MHIDRRHFMAGLTAHSAALLLPVKAFSKQVESLYRLGEEKGIDIGSAAEHFNPPAVIDIITRHCNVVTPENSLKPAKVAPSKTWRTYDTARGLYDYALDNGKKFHGHTLFWHRQPIRWAESDDFQEVKKLYGGFIRETINAFPKTASWDVFNEVLEEKSRFRNEFLIRKFGADFIEFCLKEAKSAAPDAKLVINDYHLSCAGDWCDRKRGNALSLVRELQKRGAPIDAVGIQAHLHSRYKASPQRTLSFARRMEKMGIDVYLSEMDVNDITFAKDPARRDKQVARYYYQFLSTVLSSKAVKRVTFWGISDAANWIVKGYAGDTIKGATPRPALFDQDNEPKPALEAVARALREAPVRITIVSVREAQEILAGAGYDPGTPDGVWGRKSLAALNALRADKGLSPAAELDLESQKLLKGLL